jgi:hypothetical protein
MSYTFRLLPGGVVSNGVSKQKKKASSGTEDSESDRYPEHDLAVEMFIFPEIHIGTGSYIRGFFPRPHRFVLICIICKFFLLSRLRRHIIFDFFSVNFLFNHT